MASYFDYNSFHQAMGLPQRHFVFPTLEGNHLNNSRKTDSHRLSTPFIEYQDANGDSSLKLDEGMVRLDQADVDSLPDLWTLQHNMADRSYSHGELQSAPESSIPAISTDRTTFNGLMPQVSQKSKFHLRSSLSSSPQATQPPSKEPFRKIVKPRIATTYWEEEQTTCFQVRAHNIVVSRRENDNYINGTKLLNVTGMTRGKRDGMLKIEKGRLVIRNGTMNLKGVWIPFSRAYEIARNEGVDHLLYPLFVDDIREFYQSSGQELRQEPMLDEEENQKDEVISADRVSHSRSGSDLPTTNGYPGSRMFY